jgi:hypothetical protein
VAALGSQPDWTALDVLLVALLAFLALLRSLGWSLALGRGGDETDLVSLLAQCTADFIVSANEAVPQTELQ